MLNLYASFILFILQFLVLSLGFTYNQNKQMQNKIYLSIITTGILATILGVLLFLISEDITRIRLATNLYNFGLWGSQLAGIIMLLTNGTFIKTKYFKMLKAALAVLFIGILFKLTHWKPNGNYIISLSFIGIIIVYFLSFLKKPIKKRLDYLKLSWVVVSYTLGILNFLHVIPRGLSGIGAIILWMAIIDFTVVGLKRKTIFRD